MRHFGTQGPVNPKDNYVVARSEELDDFIARVRMEACTIHSYVISVLQALPSRISH